MEWNVYVRERRALPKQQRQSTHDRPEQIAHNMLVQQLNNQQSIEIVMWNKKENKVHIVNRPQQNICFILLKKND